MRLIDLQPRWVTLHGWAATSQFIVGITFLCPHCKNTRLGVGFYPPIDRDNVALSFMTPWIKEHTPVKPVWDRAGDTFETLTLSPSINADGQVGVIGHWHGLIQNGEVK